MLWNILGSIQMKMLLQLGMMSTVVFHKRRRGISDGLEGNKINSIHAHDT
jgi:hypothetical protein